MCLKLEMANTIKFYKEEQEKILLSSAIYNGDSLWERGAVVIPNKELKILTKTISRNLWLPFHLMVVIYCIQIAMHG